MFGIKFIRALLLALLISSERLALCQFFLKWDELRVIIQPSPSAVIRVPCFCVTIYVTVLNGTFGTFTRIMSPSFTKDSLALFFKSA